MLSSVSQAEEDQPPSRGDLLIIQGSAGTEEYGEMFSTWAKRWQVAAEKGGVNLFHSQPETTAEESQKAILTQKINEVAKDSQSPLWIVMIGHGTFDGRTARFNLSGPDLSAQELDELLVPITRTTIVINCASSSAPFIEKLSQANRILLTSTRSGEQINFSHFGDYLSSAIADPAADLDKDKQTSLLEAFLIATRKTLEFYEADGRIPTENSLLDDNGDGKGTRATAFQGVRAIAQPEEAGVLLDGFRAHQFHLIESDTDKHLSPEIIARRNELEKKIELLRLQKNKLAEDDYYNQLEVLFLEIAELIVPESRTQNSRENQPEPAKEE
ncbi:hypothetical protein OAF98_00100 [Planctomicrobium sp.]|nr:hypothetical protein [Planctomicrobium sp.]MBT5019625.1 hypothetical protein [Planctomicrobium sp.]MDB4731225.1 hypothetical protein [bacterium]MDB4742857.1 hypothetical protein [Planctomicrobium sp.]